MLNRLAEHLAPFHAQETGGAGRRGAAIDIEDVVLAAVGMQMGRQDAAAAGRCPGTAFSTSGAGAVAEQHAGAAILPVENARERLGADHQRRPRLAEPQRVVGDRQARR